MEGDLELADIQKYSIGMTDGYLPEWFVDLVSEEYIYEAYGTPTYVSSEGEVPFVYDEVLLLNDWYDMLTLKSEDFLKLFIPIEHVYQHKT